MLFSNTALTLAQNTEVMQPTLFPFPFEAHIVFAILALVFFVFQFTREKKPYQLIMAIAVPFSLVLWLSESQTLFYAVGIIEAVLLFAALITSIIFRDKSSDKENAEKNTDNSAESDAEENSPEQSEEESAEAKEESSEGEE
ncbi:MAG: hypothetical protein E7497_06280 [Ruminococcus sp.]|nr:hypothetical protein [Ruminococcus sp.]